MTNVSRSVPMKDYKFLSHITVLNVFFAIICIPTAGKLVDVLGVPLSISIYYFPFVYILADILTEVYGYAIARLVLWYGISAQVLATVVFLFVVAYPPSTAMINNQSYVDVLAPAPRLVLFGFLAVFCGDIVNNYVLAKMKVWTAGRYMAARFVMSTLCGQAVNTATFYIFGLWGILPGSALVQSIIVATVIKVAIEVTLLPVTIKTSLWLKKSEGVDVFDTSTDFNPFKL